MKKINELLAQGVTPRQIRRGTVPKRYIRGKKRREKLDELKTLMLTVATVPIISISLPVIVHVPQLVFGRVTKIQSRIDKMNGMHAGLVNPDYSALFTPQPTNPTPVQFLGFITDYINADNAVKDKTGTVEERDAAWRVAYVQGVRAIIDYGNGLFRAHPELAPQIAHALGLKLKEYTVPDVDDFTVKYLRFGTVELQSKIKGKQCIFQWQASTTPLDQASWFTVDIPPTFECKTTVENLTEGKWFFRLRKIYRKGNVGAWFPPINCMVKTS